MPEQNERKRPGPKPRYHAPRQDIHIALSVETLEALDRASGHEGRPAFIERVLRRELGLADEQTEPQP